MNQWPGFSHPPGSSAPRGFDDIRMPPWALKQLEQRHEAGGFEPPSILEKAA
jgi:hypothetical protein